MKAAVYKGERRVSIEERSTPEPRNDEVLVRVRAVGICGSDVHGFEGKIPERRPPGIIMGHEAAGEVAAVGSGVEAFTVGDRVVVNPLVACGRCFFCRHGWFHLCDNAFTIGSAIRVFRDGAMCEYIAISPGQLYPLPKEMSFEEGAAVEPASNAVHVLERAELEVGGSVVVIGTGTVGLMAVQAARLAGAGKVIAVDISESRLECARSLGANKTINPEKANPVEIVLAETERRGADIAVEAAGFASTYRSCLETVRKRGKIMALGFIEPEVAFAMKALIYREISVIGCTGFTYELPKTISLIAQGKLNVKPLITHSFPLEEAQQAFETAIDRGAGAIKVVLRL
jgi:2-desacetyl-2-hydroxyethyl bacteriochlorophyllide A dehydrogenase